MKPMIRKLVTYLRRAATVLAILVVAGTAALAVACVASPFPEEKLDRWSANPQVLDAQGRPMLCIVGSDGQWRSPIARERISPWLRSATIAAEDRRFYDHPGVDPLAVARAAVVDLTSMRIVSGASTLDMQVARMMDDRPRTLWSKLVESLRALQLDQLKSKDEILDIYLNVAPYGGNFRGAEAAARYYFGKPASELSLAEAALLAGLPQAPERLRPDRRLDRALARQHIVLARMQEAGYITEDQRREAEAEPMSLVALPRAPRASHAAWLALERRPQGGRTTVDLDLQDEVQRLADEHAAGLPATSKVAVVVIDIADSSIVAMVGTSDSSNPLDGQVNGATAWRSPGSALKPLIYAAAMEAGRLNADATVYDVPIRRAGWSPTNFDHTFSGPMPAGDALRRSLNVPAILVAEGTGLGRCCGVMESAGVRLSAGAESRGGLAAVTGAVEVTLLDLTNAYATLGRGGVRTSARLFADEPAHPTPAIDAGVCATIDDILSSRRRRPAGLENLRPADVPWMMWKTGTSSGRRDAWAVGHNTRYAAGVWVGRYHGTGRVEFVGGEAAEPLLASILSLPRLRRMENPPAPPTLVVRRPLPVPAEVAAALRITSPSDGETFVAIDRCAIIRPRANLEGDLRWFLNGRLISAAEAARLELAPGRYELRCTPADGGTSSAVRFLVLTPTQAEAPSTLNVAAPVVFTRG
jgi:penicillin-binding protein 1C